jgi:hypothetical protein
MSRFEIVETSWNAQGSSKIALYWTTAVTGFVSARLGGATAVDGAGVGPTAAGSFSFYFLSASAILCWMRRVSSF